MTRLSNDQYPMLMNKKEASEYIGGSTTLLETLIKDNGLNMAVRNIKGLSSIRLSKPLIDKWLMKEDLK